MSDTVTGYIDHIIFRNEDNGYTVMVLKDSKEEELTCVGSFPAVTQGAVIEAEGVYTHHPVYGRQFQISSFTEKMPEDTMAMERYLGSGAIKGIGAALACRFAAEGYHLALCCHNSYETLQALATKLETTYSIQVLCFRGDVGDYTFICDMVQKTLDTFGQIDVLINNAGISYIGLLTDMDITDWNRIIATNLTSVFSTCRQVIPSMVHAKSGHIINISSVWGNVGASCEVAYSACKGGINSLTRALGKELAPSNIQVNAIACGVIDTDMNRCFSEEERSALIEEIPAGRMGSPEEVASLAYSLATASSYLNGQILTLDGGWI